MTAILQEFSYIHRPVNHPVVYSRPDTPPRCGIDLPQAQLRHLHVMSRRTAIINGKQTCALTWHGSGHDGIWRNNLTSRAHVCVRRLLPSRQTRLLSTRYHNRTCSLVYRDLAAKLTPDELRPSGVNW